MTEGRATKIEWSVEDGIARFRLTDPDRRNALGPDLVEQALDGLAQIEQQGAKVGVLSAEGPVFTAGGDLKEKRVPGVPPSGVKLIDAFDRSPVLWHAAVHAPVLGAGLQLLSSCARVVMSDEAFLMLPEFPHGRWPRPVAQAIAPQIGARRAMRVTMTGEKITAAAALELGLVERVVPAADLMSAVDEEVAKVAVVDPAQLDIAINAWLTRFETRTRP